MTLLRRFITANEVFVHHYASETKEHTKVLRQKRFHCGNWVLGFTWNYLGRLLRKGENNKWPALCQFVAATLATKLKNKSSFPSGLTPVQSL